MGWGKGSRRFDRAVPEDAPAKAGALSGLHAPLLRQPLDEVLTRLRLAVAHCGDLHIVRRVAPCLGLLETVEHADDDARLGRLAFDADGAAAAHEIAPAERLYGGLSMGSVVALKRCHVAGDVDLGDNIGLGRAWCFSPDDRGSAHGGAKNRR